MFISSRGDSREMYMAVAPNGFWLNDSSYMVLADGAIQDLSVFELLCLLVLLEYQKRLLPPAEIRLRVLGPCTQSSVRSVNLRR